MNHNNTFPNGNLEMKSLFLFVSPNLKSDGTFTSTPLNWAAIRALYALKFPGYVYSVCKKIKEMYYKMTTLQNMHMTTLY